jgi:uncharacterized membrane protein|tara:strand:- start:2671 stop:3345 length:675 start_codon:yes stop_codon:yes gene_type:complete
VRELNKKELIPIALLIVAALLAIYVYPLLPAEVPMHWNAAGEVDSYGSKLFHVLLYPGIIVFIYALFELIPRIEVFRKNIKDFMKHFFIMKVAIMAFMIYIFALTTLPALGYAINFNVFLMPAVGLLMVIIGYLIKFAKRNFFVGIRTPWTLASDTVWKKTHELGSWVFMAMGVWLAVVGLILSPKYLVWGILVPVLGSVVWMFVYSYLLYKKESEDFQKEPKL